MTKRICDPNWVFDFGKHKGKTAQDVLDSDIEYIFWLEDRGIAKFPFLDGSFEEGESMVPHYHKAPFYHPDASSAIH
jgi:hypothetical protein